VVSGELIIEARKPGYVPDQSDQASVPVSSMRVTLSDDEVFDRANLKLARGGVVTGRVVDDTAEPVVGASVVAYREAWSRGQRVLSPAGSAVTDDTGTFRIYGLAPGAYFVKGEAAVGAGGTDNVGPSYAPTFFPGVTHETSAQPVLVQVASESLADFALRMGGLPTVSGVVLTSLGRPVSTGRVQAIRVSGDGGLRFVSDQGSSIAADGTFAIRRLEPGSYIFRANAVAGATGLEVGQPESNESGAVRVEVSDEDQWVTLTLGAGIVLRGNVVFDARPPTGALEALRIHLRAVGNVMGNTPARVQPDGSVEVAVQPGLYWVDVAGLPQGWWLRAVSYGERDVTDGGLDVSASQPLERLEVRLVNQTVGIEGEVVDERNSASKDSSVIVITENRDLWFTPSRRHVRLQRTDQNGRFSVAALPPGRYRVIAVRNADPAWIERSDDLERLCSDGTAITVREGQAVAVSLRVVGR
jgi:protocatechuate 3,4-dioxygenase beta subunit